MDYFFHLPFILQAVLFLAASALVSSFFDRLFYGRCEKKNEADQRFKSLLKPNELIEKFGQSADINRTLVLYDKPFRIKMSGMTFSLVRKRTGGRGSRALGANMVFHGEILEISSGSEIVGAFYDFKPNKIWDWIQVLLWWPLIIFGWLRFLNFNLYLNLGLIVISWIFSVRALAKDMQGQVLSNERNYITDYVQQTCDGTTFLKGGAPKRPHM